MDQSLLQELHTFRDWVRWASSEFRRAALFFGHGTDNDWDEALVIALWSVDQPWERCSELWQARLSLSERQKLYAAVNRRVKERVPASYITGEAWFAGERFIVDSHVLVPRSPIAELIVNQFQPWLQHYPAKILDLCTGSGCIGIACAKAFLGANVDLVDISPEALVVAGKNIALHELEPRVQTIQSDGLNALNGQRYHLIVSNPPYVSEAEYASLPDEFIAEPKLGLTSGDDGFDFVRELLTRAASFLEPEGLLVVEVGYGWEAFQEAFPEWPFFWPEFEHGGCGVFLLSREQLVESIDN